MRPITNMYSSPVRASILEHLADPSFRRRLLGQATRILRDEADAEDCVQEASIYACRSADTCLGAPHVAAWIHQILANTCRMRLRALRRHRRGGGFVHLALDAASLPACTRNPETELLGKELVERLREGVHRLRPADAVVVRQSAEGVPFAEIAAEADLTTSALKSRLFRARRSVSEYLERPRGRLSAVA